MGRIKNRGLMLLSFWGFCMHNAYTINELTKIELHKTDGVHIGKLSLYFSECHDCGNPQKVKGSESCEKLVFSIPASINSTKILEKIKALNANADNEYCKIAIDHRDNNLFISFEFNPKDVALEVHTFKAIKMEKGVNFTLINKAFLQRLESKKDKPVITTVQTERPLSIMIDCGHGGRDCGALSILGGFEKDITLDIGLKVADMLNKKGFNALVTRDKDIYLELDQRTFLANGKTDLFISLHANASEDKKKGVLKHIV